MSWKGEARRSYEERVVDDALARLAQRLDLKTLPLSDEELRTLAMSARVVQGVPVRREERTTG